MIRLRKLWRESFTSAELSLHPMRSHLKPQVMGSYPHLIPQEPVTLVSSKRKPKGYVVERTEWREKYEHSYGCASYTTVPTQVFDVYEMDGRIRAAGAESMEKAINFATMPPDPQLYIRYR